MCRGTLQRDDNLLLHWFVSERDKQREERDSWKNNKGIKEFLTYKELL